MKIRAFLNRAEGYAEARGDSKLFKDRYEYYRYSNSVRESARMALDYLYGQDVANTIEDYTGV